jgi:hypothetical protein
MTLLIQPVATQHVPTVWPSVEHYFKSAVDVQEDYTLEQVKQMLYLGNWQMLVATVNEKIVGTAAINYYNTSNERVAFVTFTAGKFLAVPEALTGLKAVVLANGATCIEGAGRPAISRLWRQHFGFHEKCVIFQLKLEEKNA